MEGPNVNDLLKDLESRSPSSRQKAARTLGQIELPAENRDEVIQSLSAALADKNNYVRVAAATSLALIDPQHGDALAMLRELLREGHRDVRGSAAVALGQIGSTDPKSIAALKDALHDEHSSVQTRARESLKRLGVDD